MVPFSIVKVQPGGSLLGYQKHALVYYLKAIPWTVPGFSVATHQRYLFALQARVEAGEELSFVAWKYLIEAQRNG